MCRIALLFVSYNITVCCLSILSWEMCRLFSCVNKWCWRVRQEYRPVPYLHCTYFHRSITGPIYYKSDMKLIEYIQPSIRYLLVLIITNVSLSSLFTDLKYDIQFHGNSGSGGGPGCIMQKTCGFQFSRKLLYFSIDLCSI